jgi:hypothetical protein
MRFERVRGSFHGARAAKLSQLRHLQALVAARIDALERLEIEVHIHGQTVITAVPPNPNTDAPELLTANVDSRRLAPGFSRDTKLSSHLNHALLESGHNIPHAKLGAPEINERIHHQLTWPVVRHLSATIDLDNRNIAGRQHVSRAGIHPKREDRRMLQEPDLVRSGSVALISQALHGSPCGLVFNTPKAANDRPGINLVGDVSVHFPTAKA